MPDHLKQYPSFIVKTTYISLIFFAFNFFQVYGQEPEGGDTLVLQSDEAIVVADTFSRDPQRAALYSAILPGLGQIYNRKYWKLPIVYGGFATFIYFIDRNSRYYQDLKQKIIDPDYEMKYFDGNYSIDQLTRGLDLYKRWRDLSIIGTAGFYVLQIIDATVDAYLFDWDVGEDISLRIKPDTPTMTPFSPYNAFGFSACLSF